MTEYKIDGSLGHGTPPEKADLDQLSHDPQRILIAEAWSYSAAVQAVRRAIEQLTTNERRT